MLANRPIWDLPTRIFHWSLAVGVVLCMTIVYGKVYAKIHIFAGIIVFTLLLGRIVWGFVGTKYVRFSAFWKSKNDIRAEFSLLRQESPPHTVGHPAVAGWVMLIMMLCGLLACVTGIFLYFTQDSKDYLLKWHEIFANSMLIIAFIHIQGVVLHTFLHKDAIAFGMIHGKRPSRPNEAIGKLTKVQILIAILWIVLSYCSVALFLDMFKI